MMVIIHELEDLGLLARKPDPDDSRAKLVSFTASGNALIQELGASTRTVWQQYAKLVGKKQLETVIGGMQQLLEAAQEQDHD